MYHAFIAQAVNYQTPEGIVQGIKWVPADSVRGGSTDPSQQSGPDFGDEGGVYVPQPVLSLYGCLTLALTKWYRMSVACPISKKRKP